MDIVWFSITDLRVRDHEPLYYSNLTNNDLIHIFIWDCKWDDKTSNEIQIMGKFKKKFLKESLYNLKIELIVNPPIKPPRWAKLAIFPNPSKSKRPVKHRNNQISMNKYIAGGKRYLFLLSISS